jgi:hypothetical protein
VTRAAEEPAAVSVQQNDDMRKITGWVAIVAVPTAVTGYFGQNVPYRGFGETSGFLASVLIMLAIAVSLYVVFEQEMARCHYPWSRRQRPLRPRPSGRLHPEHETAILPRTALPLTGRNGGHTAWRIPMPTSDAPVSISARLTATPWPLGTSGFRPRAILLIAFAFAILQQSVDPEPERQLESPRPR